MLRWIILRPDGSRITTTSDYAPELEPGEQILGVIRR